MQKSHLMMFFINLLCNYRKEMKLSVNHHFNSFGGRLLSILPSVELLKMLGFLLLSLYSLASNAVVQNPISLTNFVKQEYKINSSEANHFSDQLASVPDFLQEGSIFNLDKANEHFNDLQKDFQIVEVPLWLYGTWRSESQTQDFVHVYGEGTSNEKIVTNVEIFDVVGDVISSSKKVYSIVYPGSISSITRAANLDEYQITL
ncbi:MAG: hypothetical protein SFU25_11120, partial [Candidatus Caenarcaniphilales bacterium]|nr:hypothetical protein [Candidatus Caenarcaniphilales bacterium]